MDGYSFLLHTRLTFLRFYRHVFEIVVAMIVQSVFHLKIHQNKFFLFLKNYF
jgi:hypothetical protein